MAHQKRVTRVLSGAIMRPIACLVGHSPRKEDWPWKEGERGRGLKPRPAPCGMGEALDQVLLIFSMKKVWPAMKLGDARRGSVMKAGVNSTLHSPRGQIWRRSICVDD